MALVVRIKKGVWDDGMLRVHPSTKEFVGIAIRGLIRLWREESNTPTDFFLVICDDPPPTYGQQIKGNDQVAMAQVRVRAMDMLKDSMDRYGVENAITLPDGVKHSRRFWCDLRVPSTLIDGYTG